MRYRNIRWECIPLQDDDIISLSSGGIFRPEPARTRTNYMPNQTAKDQKAEDAKEARAEHRAEVAEARAAKAEAKEAKKAYTVAVHPVSAARGFVVYNRGKQIVATFPDEATAQAFADEQAKE
jgi:hypothetical protein